MYRRLSNGWVIPICLVSILRFIPHISSDRDSWYIVVRMKRNPFVYGMAHDETADDPQLGKKREGLVDGAGRRLMEIGMAHFDHFQNTFAITDVGRIAAKYYIRHETVEVFSKLAVFDIWLCR